jgi:hypothetical protein
MISGSIRFIGIIHKEGTFQAKFIAKVCDSGFDFEFPAPYWSPMLGGLDMTVDSINTRTGKIDATVSQGMKMHKFKPGFFKSKAYYDHIHQK